MWRPPNLTLRWGAYNQPDATEQAAIVTAVTTALRASSITKRMALEKYAQAGVFPIENVAAALDALDKDSQQQADQQQVGIAALAKTMSGNGGAQEQRPGASGQDPATARPTGSAGGGAAAGSKSPGVASGRPGAAPKGDR